MRTSICLLTLWITASLSAQPVEEVWRGLGGSGSGQGIALERSGNTGTQVALDSEENPVVAWLWINRVTVRRWTDDAWETVGEQTGEIYSISTRIYQWTAALALDPFDTPIIAWATGGNFKGQVRGGRWMGDHWGGYGRHCGWAGGISANSGISADPALAIDSNGNPWVAWVDRSYGEQQIYVKRFNGTDWEEVGENSASWGGISNSSGYQFYYLDIAIGPNNLPTVVWYGSLHGAPTQIYLRRWDGASWVELGEGSGSGAGLSQSATHAYNPTVASDSQGHPTVAWVETDSLLIPRYAHIRLVRWNGSAWEGLGGSDTRGLSPRDGVYVYPPSVALSSDGAPIVAWTEWIQEPRSNNLYALRWNGHSWEEIGAGSSSGGGISLGASVGSTAPPGIAVDSLGQVALTWTTSVGVYLRTTGPGLLLPGSANGDSVIDVADLVALVNHLTGTAPITHPRALANADLDSDGEITQADADALIEMLLGQQQGDTP